MRTPTLPLGQRENQETEFKAAAALEDLPRIGREVAAMLNTSGGIVWVGIAEEEGVAVRIDPISGAQAQAGRLRDHLLDTIEPSPRGEVTVDPVPAGEGRFVIAITIRPGSRGPYAQIHRGGRYFLTRVADRVRPMTREQILPAGRAADRSEDPLSAARADLLNQRDERARQNADGLWLAIKPVPDLRVDIQDKRIHDMLCDPTLTGNRIAGWSFANPYQEPRLTSDGIVQARGDRGGVTVRRTGEIVFEVPVQGLHWKGEAWEIWPYSLLEYPTSVFRLARALYQELERETPVLADFAIFALKGWSLRPYSPDAIGHSTRGAKRYEEEDLTLPEAPFQFTADEVMESPDRCAYRILVRVYEAFSYGEEMVPREFDRMTGRLIMPR